MKFKDKFYHCAQCKKIVPDLSAMLFVEERTSRGFCSEECIEKYYAPIVMHFQSIELASRASLELGHESCAQHLKNPELIARAMSKPDEIWHMANRVNEDYYALITKFEEGAKEDRSYYVILLCTIFGKRPSFVFLSTATCSPELLDELRIGQRVTDHSSVLSSVPYTGSVEQTLSAEDELFSLIEQKKSSILAQLLQERSESDISYEQFHHYQQFLRATLESPDEVYRTPDEDGGTLLTYIKAHEQEGRAFYYFVICFSLEDGDRLSAQSIIPILSFPSIDPKLYQSYRKGEKLSGTLKS